MDEDASETEPAAGERKYLPVRLSPFAPPDAVAEARTAERLRELSFAELRGRRARIDKRLFELGVGVGEPALAVPSVRGTGLLDLDRILRKIDRLDEARELASMEREVERPERGVLGKLALDLSWLSDVFKAREIRARRSLLVSELGLALCACDQRVLGEYAPHVKRLMDAQVPTARRIDELFVEMRLVDDEFERRRAQGLDGDPPKEIDLLLTRALDSVDDVSSRVGGTIAGLGKQAAKAATKTAVAGGGQAVVGLAKGAWALGKAAVGRAAEDAEDDEPEAPPPPPLQATAEVVGSPRLQAASQPPSPAAADVPALIRELARLRDDGILTDEEFARKKRELLARL